MSFSHDELDFLCANPEVVDRAEALALTKKSMLADVERLRRSAGDKARAVAELVVARRALVAKVGPGQWFADMDSAQQATPGVVARFRSRYLRSLGVQSLADVTCSIGTELFASSWPAEPACGLAGADVDAVRVRMAALNIGNAGVRAGVVRADALNPVFRGVDAVIADPARRNSSGRISRLDQLMPPLPQLASAYERLVVKCAPGLDVTDVDEWAGQVDFVSVDGAMKEACVYSRGLVGGVEEPLRRAVMLDGRGGVEVLTSSMSDERCDVRDVGRFILEPDAAVIRAGLVRQFGHIHGLGQLDEHLAFLTGENVPVGMRGFEVLDQVPLRHMKAELARRGVGSAEIIVRGVDADPDVLRKKWKLKGQEHVTVIIARVDAHAQRQAYVCKPLVGGSDN